MSIEILLQREHPNFAQSRFWLVIVHCVKQSQSLVMIHTFRECVVTLAMTNNVLHIWDAPLIKYFVSKHMQYLYQVLSPINTQMNLS